MPAPEAAQTPRVEAPVAANAGGSSRLRAPEGPNAHKSSGLEAPVLPGPAKNSRSEVLVATKALNPRDFVRIQPLPGSPQKEGKVLARSRMIYKSSEPPREGGHREQNQFTQGHFTSIGKPYRELAAIVYLDPKKLTLYSLGQLAQKPVKKDVQEKPPEEVAEVTPTKCSFTPEADSPEPVSRLSPVRKTGKELRTLSEALARSRHHINSVKLGGDYFHILHQESLEREKAAQKTQGTRWTTEFQPPKTSSDEESEEEINTCSLAQGSHLRKLGKKKKKMNLRSFAPVYTSVLIPNPAGAKREHLFRQLCAIHWLLEALTLDSVGSMHSILTCWNPADPGGCKKTAREIEEEKLVTYMWEFFTTNKKKGTWRAQYSLLTRKISKTSTPGISQLSRQSSSCGQTPHGSETSTALCSVDRVKINVASSDLRSESAQAKEQQCLFPRFLTLYSSYSSSKDYLHLRDVAEYSVSSAVHFNMKLALQKVIQIMHEEVSKDVHKQEDLVKKTGMQRLLPVAENHRANMPLIKDQESVTPRKQQPRSCHIGSFIESKSNLCADMRQKFTEVREEAASSLHDALVSLERSREKRCHKKYQALKQLKVFRRDMERIRHLGMKADREDDEDGLKWFPVLLARLPESVKSDHYVQKILKKLEKYGKNPDLKIHPDTFLTVLADLQVWELCSPEIAAAVEFVRESIVQMPEEDFSEWLQTKVASMGAESSTI